MIKAEAEAKKQYLTKEEIEKVTRRFGLGDVQCHNKAIFKDKQGRINEPCVSLFSNEFEQDLYFHDSYTGHVFKVEQDWLFETCYNYDIIKGEKKFLVPRSAWKLAVPADKVKEILETTVEETTTQRLRAVPASTSVVDFSTRTPVGTQTDAPLDTDYEDEDQNMASMTMRTYACIKLGMPETKYPWLNSLIRRSKEQS